MNQPVSTGTSAIRRAGTAGRHLAVLTFASCLGLIADRTHAATASQNPLRTPAPPSSASAPLPHQDPAVQAASFSMGDQPAEPSRSNPSGWNPPPGYPANGHSSVQIQATGNEPQGWQNQADVSGQIPVLQAPPRNQPANAGGRFQSLIANRLPLPEHTAADGARPETVPARDVATEPHRPRTAYRPERTQSTPQDRGEALDQPVWYDDPQEPERGREQNLIRDDQVAPASLGIPAAAVRPESRPFAGPASLDIPATVKQLAFATAVALFGCVAIILYTRFARQSGIWNREGSPASRTPPPQVEQTLALGNKSLLRLVRVGNQQVLVATDASGIKSVLSVPPEFGSMLEAPDLPFETRDPVVPRTRPASRTATSRPTSRTDNGDQLAELLSRWMQDPSQKS